MREVRADKGYISADNLQTAVDHGATPYIPFKTNVTGKRGSRALEETVSLLQLQARGIPSSLSQTLKRRNNVQHDKSEVRRAVANVRQRQRKSMKHSVRCYAIILVRCNSVDV